MHFPPKLLLLASLTTASKLPSPQHLFSNADAPSSPRYKIPTIHESAIQARRILHLEAIGTLSTIFPSQHSTENRPSSVSGAPIGLMDYFADCEPETGNPIILALSIATSFKNAAAGSNVTLSLRWHAQNGGRPYRSSSSSSSSSAAALPRFSLVGHLEELSAQEILSRNVATCFVAYHPDAAWWLPGNRIHESKWVRLVVEEVYWIGGFGDRAYIGWIPVEEWKSVTKEEIEGIRLPGEKTGVWASWSSWLGFGGKDEGEMVWEL